MMLHAQEMLAEGVSPVGDVGEGPEDQFAIGQKIFRLGRAALGKFGRMEIDARLGNKRRAARRHDRQRPGRDLERLLAGVGEEMRHADNLALEQLDPQGLLHPEGLARGLENFNPLFSELFPSHRDVIQFVGMVRFGRGPETVAAANHPFLLARAAELFRHFNENVARVVHGVADDARAHVEGDDQFGGLALEAQITVPTGVGDFLDHKLFRSEGGEKAVRSIRCKCCWDRTGGGTAAAGDRSAGLRAT